MAMAAPISAQPVVPDGFEDSLVASIASPAALAFTPDGRLLIASQVGQIFVYEDGTLLGNAALDLGADVCVYRERGLLGVTVDPEFASNHFIYVTYSFNKHGDCAEEGPSTPVGRVSRFELDDDNTVDRLSEVVLIDNIPSPVGIHNLDDVDFGKDGYLYVSVGDGGCDYAGDSGCADANDAARSMNVLVGKILRITRDGGIPPDNPFMGAGSVRCAAEGQTTTGLRCQEIFAFGLRNPWRMAFDPNAEGTRFFITDVGQDTWEEIDEGVAGADYGWNIREGFCANGSTTDCTTVAPSGLTNPIHAYDRSEGCASITGGAFVPNGSWPAELDGVYFFSDYVCGTIFTLVPDGAGSYTRDTFITGLGNSSAVDLQFGPHDGGVALYYTNYENGGQVRRVAYTGGANRRPTAVVAATPLFGQLPLVVDFDASGSSDPDGDALTFVWDFGDGSEAVPGSAVSHTYTEAGAYTATLHVSDPSGGVGTATVRIDAGNTPPVPAINAPSTADRFAVGDTIVLRGSASDEEDGELPDSSLTWRVLLHHNTHTHGFLPPTAGNGVTFHAPGPENIEAAASSYLEVQLTATDSAGSATTITQALRPRTTEIVFLSSPSGATLRIDNAPVVAPASFISWVNYPVAVEASSQTIGAGSFTFSSWSDGGAAAHTILTPAEPASFTATFSGATPEPGTVTVTASTIENPQLAAEYAIDGDPNTRWGSEFWDAQWIAIDLGGETDISRVVLHWESWATAYSIDVSNDAQAWTTVFSTTAGDGGVDDIGGLSVRARYVRMLGTVRGTEWGYSLYEFEVIGESGGGPGPTPAADIVRWAADMTPHGAWSHAADSGAAGGVTLTIPDLGLASIDAPQPEPVDFVETTFTAEAGVPYRLWLRLRAIGDTKWNDSVWVQFSDAVDGAGNAVQRIGTANGLNVNLEDCSGCGVSGWGWQGGAWWLEHAGIVRFENDGTHTVRIQAREDGVEIDQMLLSPVTYMNTRPGLVVNDTTILPRTGTGGPPSSPADVVLWATDGTPSGNWAALADDTAAGGVKLTSSDQGLSVFDSPLPAPADYIEASFPAEAGVTYRVWLRLRAGGDTKWNDSVWVQFSESVDDSGTPAYRIGSPEGLNVNLEDCSGCGVSGWGWQSRAWWLEETGDVRFANTGTQTIRIQIREDGVEIDQIVLSPVIFRQTRPGAPVNDSTISPR